MDNPSLNLGRNLVSLRKARSYTQADLAKLSKIPRSTINHLESGQGNPSLSTLLNLSGAFNIPVEELLAKPTADVQLIPAAELPRKVRRSGTEVTKLLPKPIPGVELERMSLEVGARLVGVPHLKGTKEYFVLVKGHVRVRVAGESYDVNRGDVLVFPGDEKHSYENVGSGGALALSVVLLQAR